MLDKYTGLWYTIIIKGKEKEIKKMKYEEMTCTQLRNTMNQIDNDLRNSSNMSQQDKDNLFNERMKADECLRHRITEMLTQFEEED